MVPVQMDFRAFRDRLPEKAPSSTAHMIGRHLLQMKQTDKLGPPSLKIDGFVLWVHGRQFPDSEDFYDGNWLNVTAHCGAHGASVWVQGAILMLTDLERWANQCETLYKSLEGEAELRSYEPELRVKINSTDTLGHLTMHVEMTPDHMNQKHAFDFELDQTYLPQLIRDCREIVVTYPIRGTKEEQNT